MLGQIEWRSSGPTHPPKDPRPEWAISSTGTMTSRAKRLAHTASIGCLDGPPDAAQERRDRRKRTLGGPRSPIRCGSASVRPR